MEKLHPAGQESCREEAEIILYILFVSSWKMVVNHGINMYDKISQLQVHLIAFLLTIFYIIH